MNNIHFSDNAQNDLFEIKAYIAEELGNPASADSIIRKITTDIRALKQHALLGARLSSIAEVSSDYRFLVTGSYLTFYRVSGAEIYIDRILYGRRDYLSSLFGDNKKYS